MCEIPITEEEQKIIRQVQLELLSEVDRICNTYHIRYSIGYGTLLGAIRHKGYIPWDDDADILMLREEYEKFKACCQKHLKAPLFLQDHETDEEYLWGYAKLRNLNTTYVRVGQEHIACKNGVFIDIFPLDGVPGALPLQMAQDFLCFVLRKCLWAKVGSRQERTGFKRAAYAALSVVSKEKIYGIYDKLVSLSNRKKRKRVRCLLFTAPGKHWKKRKKPFRERYGFKREWLEERSRFEFENLRLWGSRDYHECLTYLYGDYMALPPQEKRLAHAPVSRLDLSRIWNDTSYWNEIYSRKTESGEPSLFAVEVERAMGPASTVVDLGCGTGRDSLFFAACNHKVLAVDLSSEAIRMVSRAAPGITAIEEDFVTFLGKYENAFDYLYSRFSLHAISANQEQAFMRRAYAALKKGGLLFIEARSIQDERFGRGEEIARNTFRYEGHARRFIDVNELGENLKTEGFFIEKITQSRGFAPYGSEDPVVIRAVCRKEETA